MSKKRTAEDTESISVEDAADRMEKGPLYVRKAIENGTLPGSYTKTENGTGSYHIPLKAFEDYMTKSPIAIDENFVELLAQRTAEIVIEALSKKRPAPTGR